MSTATARVRNFSYSPAPDKGSISERVIGIDAHNAGKLAQADGETEQSNRDERLLNAHEVAERLGVSERFIRDHTTRRSPRIPAVRLGKLIRYRRTDVDDFMAELGTLSSFRSSRLGV